MLQRLRQTDVCTSELAYFLFLFLLECSPSVTSRLVVAAIFAYAARQRERRRDDALQFATKISFYSDWQLPHDQNSRAGVVFTPMDSVNHPVRDLVVFTLCHTFIFMAIIIGFFLSRSLRLHPTSFPFFLFCLSEEHEGLHHEGSATHRDLHFLCCVCRNKRNN